MLSTASTQKTTVSPATSHTFATPVVHEIRRPASEPASFASTW
jgi:hypothetical protein